MKLNKILHITVLVTSLTLSFVVTSADLNNNQLLALQHQWAKVNYTMTDKTQDEGFDQLIQHAQDLVTKNPENAEALVWLGIIQSSYAGAKGGLGALSLAKEAKKSLEKSLTINKSALNGSAYASLGTLYHKVPGWPIGFGDDDNAKVMLEQAIEINPTGIDSNFFYAEFLFDEKDYVGAKTHLQLAMNAPSRDERPLADESRRAEISSLMAKVEKKLNKKKH